LHVVVRCTCPILVKMFCMLTWMMKNSILRCTGALVRSIERDDRLDKAVVTLLVVAQERMLTVLTPPDSAAQRPLTLALLQVRSLLHSCQFVHENTTLFNNLLLHPIYVP